MNKFEAKEYQKGLIETALLRAQVRMLLDRPRDAGFLFWFERWRLDTISLFNRKGWFDTELRNAVPFEGEVDPPGPDDVVTEGTDEVMTIGGAETTQN